MTTRQAEELADFLLGMDDAKKELIALYEARMKGDPTKYSRELQEAGEQWYKAFQDLGEFVEGFDR